MENASVRRVRMMNNRPTLLLDGADTLPLIYALSDFPGADSRTYQAQKNIAAFRQAGINLVACDTNLLLGWYKAAEGDYDALRAELSYVLDANPDARIFLRLHLNPPYWWLRDHPDELIVYRTSEGDLPGVDNGDSDRLIRGDKDRLLRVSTASELWRREAGDRLRGFLKSLKNTPEGRALAAVQVAYGLNGEWHQLGTDVGPAMQTAFRRHLRTLYTDEAALQTAWNDPSVTFDTAPFHPETFQSGDDGLFRDPRLSRRIIDAQKFIQLNNAIDARQYAYCPESISAASSRKPWARPCWRARFTAITSTPAAGTRPSAATSCPRFSITPRDLWTSSAAPRPTPKTARSTPCPCSAACSNPAA